MSSTKLARWDETVANKLVELYRAAVIAQDGEDALAAKTRANSTESLKAIGAELQEINPEFTYSPISVRTKLANMGEFQKVEAKPATGNPSKLKKIDFIRVFAASFDGEVDKKLWDSLEKANMDSLVMLAKLLAGGNEDITEELCKIAGVDEL